MKKRIIILTAVLVFICSFSTTWAEPNITSPSAILMDAKTGRILYEKESEVQRFPASTTKIMTAILCIEQGNLNDIVTIGTNPPLIEKGSSQIYLIPGEQLTLEQLLYAMMLESANDAAVAIAEHISGSVEEFAKLMNKRARELGALNTNFVNPNGLHDDTHVTTAKDMALIAKHAMTLPKFREVVSTLKYTIPATNKQPERNYITNTNKLLWQTYKKYSYEYAIGIKTGYTTKAKHNLVAGALKDGMELISVVMNENSTNSDANMYTNTIALFEYGFNNFTSRKLLTKDQIVTTITIPDSDEKLNLLAAEDFYFTMSENETSKIESNITLLDNISKPISKGQVLGYISYSIDGEEIYKVNLLSAEELLLPEKKSVPVLKWFFRLFIAYIVWRTIVVTSRYIRKKKKKKKKTSSCTLYG
ncbi:D-alanyl-D-alanine carboxypeptidase family protein [Lutispora thermophila]|uniref:serine-type D-Ala-D-Ala carboxypeptidase n=1 Tax=Lutispora thermophila DSM 19022 TaxID=1122184 RepID=A0A1M6DB59_9FIRM|nr:D-alanyl-D-alanine carboxypeptidase family protein [Lutispora thermophila]SHI70278.1 D-alanyl-D-alanine carboxypeptidase (penicillin-binding protein 5/6) [Lutispora thermophila DSM 19022]